MVHDTASPFVFYYAGNGRKVSGELHQRLPRIVTNGVVLCI